MHVVKPASDKTLSRQHARVSVRGGRVHVADLGSTNGLVLGGERVREAWVGGRGSVQLGGVTLAIHTGTWGEQERIAGFAPFRIAARDAIAAARDQQGPLSLLLLGVGAERCAELGELLGDDDRLAVYGGNTFAVLLGRAGEREAERWVKGAAKRAGAKLRAGIAVYPDAGSTVDALLDAARGALARATASAPVVVVAAPAHLQDAGGRVPADEDGVIVRCPATAQVFELARRAARSQLPVLVLGETGTGKEVLAGAIHRASPRAERAFRVVNCGALPPSLMESVLFGHEKGAFTGALQAQAGLFEQADGGTLFLDEVGELSAPAQAALLRVLEQKTLTRVGGSAERRVDVRVVAATHRDLKAMCAAGGFREDLLHRLNAVTLTLPPLRERREEIPAFAERFLRGADLPGDCPRAISPDALARLCAYHWPGNVRELKNTVERAAVLAYGETIEVDDLPEELRSEPRAEQPRRVPTTVPFASVDTGVPFKQRLQQHEAELMRRALAEAGGNKTKAAQLLRMPLRTFMKRIGEYGIE